MINIKEITVEYFYTKQPKQYESERATIGFKADVDINGADIHADQILDKCMEIVHARLGLDKDGVQHNVNEAPIIPSHRRKF